MPRLLPHLRRRQRPLLLGLSGLVMFALWFGVWLRVLPLRPRLVIKTTQGFEPRMFTADGGALIGTRAIRENGQPKGEVRRLDLSSGEEIMLGKIPDDWRLLNGVRGLDLLDVRLLPRLEAELRLLEKSNYVDLSAGAGDRVAIRFQSMAFPVQAGLRLWDTLADRQILDRPGDYACALSPCGSQLVTTAYVGSERIHLWNARDGSHVFDLDLGFDARRPRLHFAPDGKHLAIHCHSSLHVWNLDPLRRVATLNDLHDSILTTNWDFVLGQCDRFPNGYSLRLVEVGSGKEIARINPFPAFDDLSTFHMAGPALVPRSDWLVVVYCCQWREGNAVARWLRSILGWKGASAGGVATTVQFYHPGTWRVASAIVHASPGYPVFSADGTFMALGTPEEATISIYDLPPRRPVALYLLFSALPALLFTGVLWWRVR